jgi:hypothetical protein
MTNSPSGRQRRADYRLLFRAKLATLGPKPKKKYSLAMLIDENDLVRHRLFGLRLVQEKTFRPVSRDRRSERKGIGTNVGITGERTFRRQDPYSALIAQVTPFTSQELAELNVEEADDQIFHDPLSHVSIY